MLNLLLFQPVYLDLCTLALDSIADIMQIGNGHQCLWTRVHSEGHCFFMNDILSLHVEATDSHALRHHGNDAGTFPHNVCHDRTGKMPAALIEMRQGPT